MIQQGHKYLCRGMAGVCSVIAMERTDSPWVKVAEIDESIGWLGRKLLVPASTLTPLPMKYFGGEVPA